MASLTNEKTRVEHLKEDIEDESFEYWSKENYPLDRGWVYYKDIFKKAKVDK